MFFNTNFTNSFLNCLDNELNFFIQMMLAWIDDIWCSCWIVLVVIKVFYCLRSSTSRSSTFKLRFMTNWPHVCSTTQVPFYLLKSLFRCLWVWLRIRNFIVNIVCCVSKFLNLSSKEICLIKVRNIDMLNRVIKWCRISVILEHPSVYWCTQIVGISPNFLWMASSISSYICLSSSQSISRPIRNRLLFQCFSKQSVMLWLSIHCILWHNSP